MFQKEIGKYIGFIADNTKAQKFFGFVPKTTVDSGINKMIQWIKSV